MIERLVSSANKRMHEPISLTMPFMKIRKSNGLSIEPCGTPANSFDQSELTPGSIARCHLSSKSFESVKKFPSDISSFEFTY